MPVALRVAIAAGAVAAASAWSLPAAAQTPTYQCVNESKRINIPAQSLDRALDRLSQQTNCPISRDAKLSGLKSKRVVGTFTPEQALKAMVQGTGVSGQAIRQGLGVTAARQSAAGSAAPFNCQNRSLPINVGQMPLEQALASLSRQTRCPIAHDFPISGLISRPVRGTYTPLTGLRAMLGGTGLQGVAVRQGMQVVSGG